MKRLLTLAILNLLLLASSYSAEKYIYSGTPKFAYGFSDHMVLQRDTTINVWGFADPGTSVTISIDTQSVNGQADQYGKWLVELAPMSAGGPYILTLTSGATTIDLIDVLVGEVWICSGQSNMRYNLDRTDANGNYIFADELDAIAAQTNFPIRHAMQFPDGSLPWLEVNIETVTNGAVNPKTVTAVGYFFAKHLREGLGDVPIGIIQTGSGGKAIRHFTPKDVQWADPLMHPPWLNRLPSLIDDQGELALADAGITNGTPEEIDAAGIAALDAHQATIDAWLNGELSSEILPVKIGGYPGYLYYESLPMLKNMKFKGMVWYQGESDAGQNYQYPHYLNTLIDFYRDYFNVPDMPFIQVVLPPYQNGNYPIFAEGQLSLAARKSFVGAAFAPEAGDELDIHPPKKEIIGERAALSALAVAYGQTNAYLGPKFSTMSRSGDKIQIDFTDTAGGLTLVGTNELVGFDVAGPDGVAVDATALLTATPGRVELTIPPALLSEEFIQVRLNMKPYYVPYLYGSNGLPALPFSMMMTMDTLSVPKFSFVDNCAWDGEGLRVYETMWDANAGVAVRLETLDITGQDGSSLRDDEQFHTTSVYSTLGLAINDVNDTSNEYQSFNPGEAWVFSFNVDVALDELDLVGQDVGGIMTISSPAFADIVLEDGQVDDIHDLGGVAVPAGTRVMIKMTNTAGGDTALGIESLTVHAEATSLVIPNTAPVFSSGSLVRSNAGYATAYNETIAGLATDVDNDPLVYRKLSGPYWLQMAFNGELTGTPAASDLGTNTWTIEVSDEQGGTDTATLTIEVYEPNFDPFFAPNPVLKSDGASGVAYSDSLAGSATDMNGDPVTYSKVSGPAWLSIAPDGALSGTPRTDDIGIKSWTVRASDGLGGSSTATLSINVLAPATLVAHYPLNGDANDAAGTYDGTATLLQWPTDSANPSLGGSAYFSGAGASIDCGVLPLSNIGTTISYWMKADSLGNRELLNNLSATTDTSGSGLRIGLRSNGTMRLWTGSKDDNSYDVTESDTGVSYAAGVWVHHAWVFSNNTISFYVDGVLRCTKTATKEINSTTQPLTLGRVRYATNYDYLGNLDDVRIYDNALPANEVAVLFSGQASSNKSPIFASDPIVKSDAVIGEAYSGTLADSATDLDGNPLTYSLLSEPTWLSIAPDGSLSGTPGTSDGGTNSWSIQVSDGQGGIDIVTLIIAIPPPLPDGLIALYRMEGNANDATGTYDGTANLLQWPTDSANPSLGGSGDFTAAGASIDCGMVPLDKTATTIAYWLYANNLGNQEPLSNWSATTDTSGSGLRIGLRSNGKVRLWTGSLNNNSYDFTEEASGVAYAAGVWVHHAWVFEGSQIKFYKDGQYVSERTASKDISSAHSLLLGRFASNSTFDFNGYLDDVRIYNEALDIDQIESIYELNLAPVFDPSLIIAGLQLWLRPEQGVVVDGSNDVTIWQDGSGRGHHMTPIGSGKPRLVSDTVGTTTLSALEFNRAELDTLRTPFSVPLNMDTFTVSFAFKPTSQANYIHRLGASSGWNSFYFHGASSGAVYVGTNSATRMDPDDLPAGTLETNKWQIITFSFDNGHGAFYKNGVLLASKTGMALPADWTQFFLGEENSGTSINGLIGEVAVYDWALHTAGGTVLADWHGRLINKYLDEIPDSDGDSLPDWWEQRIVDASLSDSDSSNDLADVAAVLPEDDFDGDGSANIIERAFNSDPTSGSSHHKVVSSMQQAGGSDYLSISYRRLIGGSGVTGVNYTHSGITWGVMQTNDLKTNWNSGTDYVEVVGNPLDNGDGTETVTVRSKTSVQIESNGFLRLRLTAE